MNTKKVITITACAAVLIGSAFAFRKVKKEVTRILKAEEPKDDTVDCKPKVGGCSAREMNLADCCEARNSYAGRKHADCDCEAMSPCEDMAPMDMAPMGKARLVD